MNVTVENLAPCKKLVRFEVDAQAVDEAFASVTKDFVKQAKMSGFRPGKAPEAMVIRQYAKDIDEEVKRKLTGETYRKGVKEQTSPTQIKGHKVAASKDEPQLIVKSDKTGATAAHKPSALKKTR